MIAYESVPLARLLTVRAVISSVDKTLPKGFYFPGEAHDFWEAVYVVSGNVMVSADAHIYRLSCGQIIFHKPMEFHRIWTKKDSDARIYLFAFAAAGDGMAGFSDRQFRLSMPQESMLRRSIEELAGMLTDLSFGGNPPESRRQIAAIHLEEFLLSLLETEPLQAVAASDGAASAYRQIVETIHAHLGEELRVSDLARYCNRSISSLNKVFRRFSDRGVMQYVLALKIRKAMEWLDEGVPIGRISDQLAFSSPNYFHVAFKRETGMTPSEYRDRMKDPAVLSKL